MLSVTSGSTITATDTTTDWTNLSDDIYEAYQAYQRAVAIAVILSIFFFFVFVYITVFYAVHKRCPRLGWPVFNPCAKQFEQPPTTDTNAVEVTIVAKEVIRFFLRCFVTKNLLLLLG